MTAATPICIGGCGSRRRSRRSTSRGVRCPRSNARTSMLAESPATPSSSRSGGPLVGCGGDSRQSRWRSSSLSWRERWRSSNAGRRSRRPTRRRVPNAPLRSKPSSAAPGHCVGHNATRPHSSPSRPTGWRTPRGRGRRCSARSPTRSGSSMHTASRALGARVESSCPTAARRTSPTNRGGCAPTISTPERSARPYLRSAPMTAFPCSWRRRTAVASRSHRGRTRGTVRPPSA